MSRVGINRILRIAVAVGAAALLALPVLAEQDHLIGYKAKDEYKVVPPPGPYILNHSYGFENCELKRVQFFLTQADKNGGDDPRGGPAGNFVCYKAKCTGTLPNPDVDSQFGTIGVTSRKAKLVCLPVVDPSQPTPTPTPAPLPCGCEATTGGFCWFLGADHANCDDTCAANGLSCSDATRTYAGSDGTLANCAAVLSDLVPGDPAPVDSFGNPSGFGCVRSTNISFTSRLADTVTTCDALPPTFTERVCACE